MNRRGFTLLETMLAAAIGSLVVLACLGMFFLMNRTDRALEVRAQEQGELERLRKVMERTFTTLLMSDEPRTIKNDTNVAQPVDAAGNGAATDPKAALSASSLSNALAARYQTRAPSILANDRLSGQSNNKSDSASLGDSTAGTGTNSKDSSSADKKNLRIPPPARLFLGVDETTTISMARHPLPGQPLEDAGVPQRLEVVLFQSPVPTYRPDPFDEALPPKWALHQQAAKRARERGQEDAADRAADDQSAADMASMPVRAVRGAFEVHPQPPKGVVNQGQVVPAALQPGVSSTGLWQVWWVPLPRLNSDGSMLLSEDDPDQTPAQPYLVASDLRFIHWTVFHQKERQNQLVSVWQGDLPAYVEVAAETASGQAVNWMFEVDWANGPEVPKPTQKTAGQTDSKTQGTTTAQPLQLIQPAAPGGRPSK